MAVSRQKKHEQLQALIELFKGAAGAAFMKFDKATVMEVQAVRRALRAKGMTYTVIKRTLIALAAKEAGLAEFSADDMEGMVAVITSPDDIVLPAQSIKEFKKEYYNKKEKHAKFDFAGAVFEGKFLEKKAAEIFADTPTREQSIATITRALSAGPRKFRTILQSGIRRLHNVTKNADKFTA